MWGKSHTVDTELYLPHFKAVERDLAAAMTFLTGIIEPSVLEQAEKVTRHVFAVINGRRSSTS